MIAIAYYLVKVIVCSAILFLYYHFALRNKLYHQWNRFYLIASVILSLLIPYFEFNVLLSQGEKAPSQIKLFYFIHSADAYVAKADANGFWNLSKVYWPAVMYAAVCCSLLVLFILSLKKIRSIITTNTVTTINNVNFINTNEKSAPFSFFNFIFWNKQIDINSASGQLIFQHELVHVREKHTLDKLFMQLLLVLFWCNPIFWLIRKELRMIHEFIADKKAIGQQDITAFAAMILKVSFPDQQLDLTNHFFQSPIKRRLTMLTKNQKAKISYASRLLALPVTAFLVFAFTVKTKANNETERIASLKRVTTNLKTDTISNPIVFIDGVEKGRLKDIGGAEKLLKPEKIKALFVFKGKEAIEKFGQKGKDGVIEIISVDAPPPPPPPVPNNNGKEAENLLIHADSIFIENGGGKDKETFVVIDGKERGLMSVAGLQKELDPAQIESMEVLKDKTAIEKFGAQAKNGAIIITTRTSNQLTERKIDLEKSSNVIFEKVEEEATFPGGVKAWRTFLEKNLNPNVPIDKGAKAGTYKVEILFIVSENGELSGFQTLTNHGYGMEEEVERLMRSSPNWIPAQQNGQPVAAYRKQPITFVIEKQ